MLPEPILQIGKIGVHMYGVMIALGLMLAFIVLTFYPKKLGYSEKFLDLMFYTGIGAVFAGFLSSALWQGLYNYIENPEAGFHIDGGITFIGGLIGGAAFFIAVYFIFRRRVKERLYGFLPIVSCSITVAHGFGRIGCFFAGCCYGKETDSIFGVTFPGMHYAVHPTQLYEAGFLLLLFGLLSLLYFKNKYKYNMSIYLISYGIFRFFLEFLRGDHRGQFVGNISPSQFWSVPIVLVGVALILYENLYVKKHKTEPNEDTAETAVENSDNE